MPNNSLPSPEPPLNSDEFRSRAEAYCARAEHCAEEVRTKLYAWGCPSESVDSIIDHLYALRFLDDARYCHAFAHDKLLYQQWGKIKIQAHLQARRLPSAAIQEALSSIDEIEYNRILQSLISQKSRSLRPTPKPTPRNTSPDRTQSRFSRRDEQNSQRDQLIRFLLQRGFSYSDILSALSQ